LGENGIVSQFNEKLTLNVPLCLAWVMDDIFVQSIKGLRELHKKSNLILFFL